MHINNLLEYNKNYRKTTGSFWNYYRDELNEESTGGGNVAIKYSVRNSKFLTKKQVIEEH